LAPQVTAYAVQVLRVLYALQALSRCWNWRLLVRRSVCYSTVQFACALRVERLLLTQALSTPIVPSRSLPCCVRCHRMRLWR
jgi:hypothetical protein